MVLRAGSEFPLNTGPWEEAWQKAASSDSMGWGVEWAHLRHPSRCKPHSCISARCSAGRRSTHTHTQDLSYLCPAVERWLCRFLRNTLVVFPSLAWTLANFCLPELENVFFHWNFQVSEQFQLHYQWDHDKNGQDQCCRYRAMPNYGTWEPFRVSHPIQCFIHLLTQCKPDCKCCPSPSACCSLHGEGIQAYKPRRNLLAIVAQG